MARQTWSDRIKQLEDGLAWLERKAPGRAYEIEDTRRAIEVTKAKMREFGKSPSSPITERERWALIEAVSA